MLKINGAPISSHLYVAMQFTGIGAILFTGPWICSAITGLFFQIAAILLASFALFVMRKSKIRILPDLAQGATLITSGPYKYIRHPMYTSLLMFFIPLIVEQFTPYRLAFLTILFISLILKILHEEKQLANNFTQFKSYQKKSKMLIPFIL